MSKNTGGPAFPRPVSEDDGRFGRNQEQYGAQDGMTLRDYFTANAPVTIGDAMLRCGFCEESIGMFEQESRTEIFTVLAEMRGEYADAMLAERAK